MSNYERMKDIKPYKTKIHLNSIRRCSPSSRPVD